MQRTTPETVERWLQEESEGLRALARSLLRGESDVEDCVQDAWAAALDSPPPRQPSAWLRSVVRHFAFRQGRDRARRIRREERATRPDVLPSAHEVAARIETRRVVLAAVARLGEPYRTSVTLRYFDGLSPTRIARLQGIPVKTVKTRLSRGLAQLRADLDEAHGGKRSAWVLLLADATSPTIAPPAALGSALPIGGALAVKKVLAVVFALIAVLTGGAAVVLLTRGESEPLRSEVTETPKPEASTLESAPPSGPKPRVPSGTDAWVIREGQPVPNTTFAGRVVDPEGRGVPGAEVRLVWSGAHSSEPPLATHNVLRREFERREGPKTITEVEGYYRFDRPYASRAMVLVEAAGFSLGIEGTVFSGKFTLVRLARGSNIGVSVRTESGEAVADAEVRLLIRASDSKEVDGTHRNVLASARTDATGLARLHVSLPKRPLLPVEVDPSRPDLGLVEVLVGQAVDFTVVVPFVKTRERRVVDADTGAPIPTAYVDVLSESSGSAFRMEGARRRFRADSDGVVRWPFQDDYRRAYATAPGYEVVNAFQDPLQLTRSMTVEGRVLDPEGKPVKGAAVLVVIPGAYTPFEEAYVGRSPVAAWSDGEGRFSLEFKLARMTHGEEPPDRGTRHLVAVAPGRAAAIFDSIPVQPGRRTDVTLRFPRAATLTLTIVDVAGNPVTSEMITVGHPIVMPPNWPAPEVRAGGLLDTVSLLRHRPLGVDALGRCTVDDLPPGLTIVQVGTLRTDVRLEEGESKSLRIVRGATPGIRGRVLSADGEPLVNMIVWLSGADGKFERTDIEGRFEFQDVPAGEHVISSQEQREDGQVLPFRTRARPGDEIELRAPAGPGRLRITVVGPREGTAEYRLASVTGDFAPKGVSLGSIPTSRFETPGFAPGPGFLFVKAQGFGWTVTPFDVAAGQTADVRVELRPAGTVEIRVAEGIARKGRMTRLRRGAGFPERVFEGDPSYGEALQRVRNLEPFALDDGAGGGRKLEDVTPGIYEASYGYYEKREWVSLATAPVDVPSGGTVQVTLAP